MKLLSTEKIYTAETYYYTLAGIICIWGGVYISDVQI